MERVSLGLSDDSTHHKVFRDILMDMRFMPAGRVQTAIGSPKMVTAFNCFASGTIHDSFVHGVDGQGLNSIMDVARQAAATMRMGGGIGYDFSTLRPAGSRIEGVQSTTYGPLAFAPLFDAICQATSSAGNRRGAQMGVLRIDHPDVMAFIRAKQPSPALEAMWEHVDSLPGDHPARPSLVSALQETLRLTGFNLSLAVTDEFMDCLASGRPFALRFGGATHGYVDPRELWEAVMKSTWDWAEPGVLFIDRINERNNLRYCETIAATNPCAEQPLPPHGACLLGSFNLARYITPSLSFDWGQFRRDIAPVTQAMDNVVDATIYPLPQQEAEAKRKRRMGLGVTGLANAAEALGMLYGTQEFLEFESDVLTVLRDESYMASSQIARRKGSFPLFDARRFGESPFIRSLPPSLRAEISAHGVRNSHLTSIAPTGTISYCADNVSSSIEPVFMHEGQRLMNTKDGKVVVNVLDYGLMKFGNRGRAAEDVTASQHVDVLCVAANLVDSSVSKTCNVSPAMPWDDFKAIYTRAYEGGAKGCTTFNPGGRRMGIFIAKETRRNSEDERAPELVAEGTTCQVDMATGRRSCE
jgi:ribonucleoside-diphosphate reductase alpha chain